MRLGLNGCQPFENVGAGTIRGNDRSSRLAFLRRSDTSGEVAPSKRRPNLHSTRQRTQVLSRHIRLHANRAGPIFWLVVADDAAFHHFPVTIQNPDGIRAFLEYMLQEVRATASCLCLSLQCHPAKSRQLRTPQIVQKFLRLVGSDLERFWEPQQQAAIDQRVADDEHEDDWKKGNGHCANDHLRLEAGTELFSAAFRP